MKREQETSVCICMSVNGEIHNVYNLYIIENAATIVSGENFTVETNSF